MITIVHVVTDYRVKRSITSFIRPMGVVRDDYGGKLQWTTSVQSEGKLDIIYSYQNKPHRLPSGETPAHLSPIPQKKNF